MEFTLQSFMLTIQQQLQHINIIPRTPQNRPMATVGRNPRHGTCMASTMGGRDTGTYPILREINVVTWGGPHGDGKVTTALHRIRNQVESGTGWVIINMSLGVRRHWWHFQTLMEQQNRIMKRLARTNRVLFVVAAGNEGTLGRNIKTYPVRFANNQDRSTVRNRWYIDEILVVGGSDPDRDYAHRHPSSNGGIDGMVYSSYINRCADHGAPGTRDSRGTSGGK
jgi:hypothetical protein